MNSAHEQLDRVIGPIGYTLQRFVFYFDGF